MPEGTPPPRNGEPGRTLRLGSDVEIAGKLIERLEEEFGQLVADEGSQWNYNSFHWEPIPEAALRRAVHKFDGNIYGFTKGGEAKRVSLSKSRVDSVLNEADAMLDVEPEGFFAKTSVAVGINCTSGFISIDATGAATLTPHDPEHRQRHVLPHSWAPPEADEDEEDGDDDLTYVDAPSGSLLHALLEGVFRDDPDALEKKVLLQEIAGVAALGYSTRMTTPRAIVLWGKTAENGKSQVLQILRGLLPESAVVTIPADKLADERYLVRMVGKLLNTSDELSGEAVASDTFKKCITGDPISARDVYKASVDFKPQALHVYATNLLPAFRGGVDRGILRRMLVMAFLRTIPEDERVRDIGARIIEEEGDILLSWAVRGACRVVRQGSYTMGAAAKADAELWKFDTDPVLAWAKGALDVSSIQARGDYSTKVSPNRVIAGEVYAAFRNWAIAEGFTQGTLPGPRAFWSRVTAHYPTVNEEAGARLKTYCGLRLISEHEPPKPFSPPLPEAPTGPPVRHAQEWRYRQEKKPPPVVPVITRAMESAWSADIPF